LIDTTPIVNIMNALFIWLPLNDDNTTHNTRFAASLQRVGRGAFYKLYLLWRRGRKLKEIRRPAASPAR